MGDTQWQTLDGDAGVVQSKGEAYSAIAQAIQRSTQSLKHIVDDTTTTAQSMTATRKLAGDVLEDIAKAFDRYDATGRALTTYAGDLGPAIEASTEAANQLAVLREDQASAQRWQESADREVDHLPADAAPQETAQAEAHRRAAHRYAGEVGGAITTWEGKWQDAKDAKDRAARNAGRDIAEVVTGSKVHGLKDSGWDKFKHVMGAIYKGFKVVCDVAGILAVFLAWVPGLGEVLLALAAIGSIISIVEGMVKMVKHGFSWGALLDVGLGVLGLFGGKAIGSVAKYAKARSVVQTTARLSTRAAKVKFGTTAIKDARRTLAMTRGERVTDVLKSPFIRSASDKAVAGMVKNNLYKNAFKSWRGSKFPLPYKDGGMRFAFGNDDVVDMSKHFMKPGMVLDDVTFKAMTFAQASSVATNLVNISRKVYTFGSDIHAGDAWKSYGDGVSLGGTTGVGGSYDKVAEFPGKVAGWSGS